MEVCPVCQKPRTPGTTFCDNCGHRFEDKHCPQCGSVMEPEASFCDECGYKIPDPSTIPVDINTPHPMVHPENSVAPPPPVYQVPDANEYTQPNQYAPSNQFAPPHQDKPKRNSKGLIIGIAAAVVIIIVAVLATQLMGNKAPKSATPAAPDASTTTAEKKEAAPPVYSYDCPKVIHPALYQSNDYVVYFKGSSEVEKEMLLTVEIPGFTQKYEQKIVLKPQELKMKVHPPLVQGVLKTLNTSKDAQIVVTLQDTATQKYLIKDSKPVNLLSKYDMKWASDDGKETYYEDICAWVTPENPKIKELLRNSIDQLAVWSNASLNEIVGYQQIAGLQPYDVTYYQLAAIFETLRSHYGVRYNATPVSTSGSEAQQRIALPEDVINQKSGLCIETAVTMASAIEATGMHPMILILPDHAQVAVETWPESGEYLFIETTALTETNWDNIIIYPSKDQWSEYLSSNNIIVIDLELARKDGIKPME